MKLSLREIAKRAGVSAATVSRVIHSDPRISEATQQRVRHHLQAQGYELDPIVSTGMSRIRRKEFHRETIVVCSDKPREATPWLHTMFKALDDYGAQLGYRIEYTHFNSTTQRELNRLVRIWRARGFRAVLLGPFNRNYKNLPFQWDGMAWVCLGRALESPVLHLISRDYALDIQKAVAWLEAKGCRRLGFLYASSESHTFYSAFYQAGLFYTYGNEAHHSGRCVSWIPRRLRALKDWFSNYQPDGLILSGPLPNSMANALPLAMELPKVFLSPSPTSPSEAQNTPYLCAHYEAVGQTSVNMIHRLLQTQQFGLPKFRQTVLLESVWHHS